MIRRFGAALIGLALCIPVFTIPVAAHGATPFVVSFTEQANDTLVGTVANHTTSRRGSVTVTATWENGTVDIVDTAVVQITNLAPHATTGFELDPDADVSALGAPTSVTATGNITGTKPAGALQVAPGSFATDAYTANVTNDGTGLADNVVLFAVRANGATMTDAAASAPVDIAAGVTAPLTINFAAGSTGGDVVGVIARTTAGPFYTSWNNYFGDLGNTTESFVSDIIWLAEEGITTGCGDANFCPNSGVTREQMAVFLDRAIVFADESGPSAGFTDISGLSPSSQHSINVLADVDNGPVTGGCATGPLRYCPSQTVTRGQMSKFIVTAYGLTPLPCAAEDAPCSFTDDEGHFSEPYNEAMKDAEITTGCGTNVYCPNSPVTRAQMARFIRLAEDLP